MVVPTITKPTEGIKRENTPLKGDQGVRKSSTDPKIEGGPWMKISY